MRHLCLALCAFATIAAVPALAQDAVVGVSNAEALFASPDPRLNTNKQAAYHIVKDLLEAGHWELADRWLTERYIQHNPLAASGRAAVVAFFTQVMKTTPKPIPARMRTKIVSVVAEGDLVVVTYPRTMKDPGDRPGPIPPPGSTCGGSRTAGRTSIGTARRDKMTDPFDLARFVAAQEGSHDRALAEIRRGRKTGHWMWYVFPQIAGLGRSGMARAYAIGSLDEARAYLAHPLLGPRLRECVAALEDIADADAERVFGGIDAMKLRSSLTLFEAAGGGPHFAVALARWCGSGDPATLRLLSPP